MVVNILWNTLCHSSYKVAFQCREMGGRKFRLGTHRKNEERRSRERRKSKNSSLTVSLPVFIYFNRTAEVNSQCLVVSLPVSVYLHAPAESLEVLSVRLSKLQVPPSWVVAQADPLLICQLASHDTRATVQLSLLVRHDFSWAVSVGSHSLDPTLCPDVPDKFTTAFSLNQFLILLDKMRLCSGNSDEALLEMWKYRYLTLNSSYGKNCCNSHCVCVIYK